MIENVFDDFPEFATAFTKDAIVMRDQLPDDARQTLMGVMDELAANPDCYPQRTTAVEKKADEFIYRHPGPQLELTYKIDRDRKKIYFIHVAALKLNVAKPLFISYAHEDKKWLVDLRKWLTTLERRDLIRIWDDRDIKSGDKWLSEIEASLTEAKVALLLVSQDFVNSGFIATNEFPLLLKAARMRGMKLLWVAVDLSTIEDAYPELVEIQAINTDPEQPLAQLNQKELAREFKEIYKKIKELVER